MNPAEAYRIKAAQLDAEARREKNPTTRLELFHLATAYLRLAEQAERNSHLDIVYETPPHQSQAD
jgi:hypothetical protein